MFLVSWPFIFLRKILEMYLFIINPVKITNDELTFESGVSKVMTATSPLTSYLKWVAEKYSSVIYIVNLAIVFNFISTAFIFKTLLTGKGT